MSFETIRQAWNTPCQSHTEKVVLAALACAANDSLECWPSVQALMRQCNLSERAVQKQIRSLQEKGFIEIRDGGGKHQCNHYVLKLPNPAPDTGNGKPRMRNPVSHDANPARRAPNPARRAPQQPGTAKEQPGGERTPPLSLRSSRGPEKTIKEIDSQIKDLVEDMEKLKVLGGHQSATGFEWRDKAKAAEWAELYKRKKELRTEKRNR